MIDREKVIKTLTDALTAKENYPWAKAEMSFEFIEMLLELLKEQEPAEPVMKKGRLFTALTCRKCGYFFPTGTKPNYCQECGQAVKWE